MTMLRGQDPQNALVDAPARPGGDPDRLAGPFAHVVVDEAQELTDAEWQMLLLRLPVPQLHHRRGPCAGPARVHESWEERLERIGFGRVTLATAQHQLPDAERGHGRGRAGHPGRAPGRQRADLRPPHRLPVVHGRLRSWIRSSTRGSPRMPKASPASSATRRSSRMPRVRSLTPELSKGLEFDLVVLIDPERFGQGIEGAVDRYVAMTRATQRLVILSSS